MFAFANLHCFILISVTIYGTNSSRNVECG